MTILSDAYNLLKDPGKREGYLRYGAGWSHGHAGPSRRAARPPPYAGRPSGFAHASGPFPTWGYGPFHEPFGAGPRPHPTWAYQHHAQWSQPGSTGYAAWSYSRSGSESGQGTTTASANATGPRAGQVSTSLTIGAGLFVVLWSALSATNSYRASVPMPLAGADMSDRRAFTAPPDPTRSPISAPTSSPAWPRRTDGSTAISSSASAPWSSSASAASSSSPPPPSPRLPPPPAPRPDREPPPQLVATPPPALGNLLAPGTNNRHEEARNALAAARAGRDVHGARRRELLDRQLRRLEIADVEAGRRGTGHVETLSLPPPPSSQL